MEMHKSVAPEAVEPPKVVVPDMVALRAAPIVAEGIHEGMVKATAERISDNGSTIVPGIADAALAGAVCFLINCNASTYFRVLHLL